MCLLLLLLKITTIVVVLAFPFKFSLCLLLFFSSSLIWSFECSPLQLSNPLLTLDFYLHNRIPILLPHIIPHPNWLQLTPTSTPCGMRSITILTTFHSQIAILWRGRECFKAMWKVWSHPCASKIVSRICKKTIPNLLFCVEDCGAFGVTENCMWNLPNDAYANSWYSIRLGDSHRNLLKGCTLCRACYVEVLMCIWMLI